MGRHKCYFCISQDHVARMSHLKSVINKNQQFLSQARERMNQTDRRSAGRRPGGNFTTTRSQSQSEAGPESGLVSSGWSGKAQARLELLDQTIEQNRERLARQPGPQVSFNQSPLPYRHHLPKPSVMTPFKSPALKKEGKQ